MPGSEIIPAHIPKRINAQVLGEEARYYNDRLTKEEAALINRHVRILLFFGEHGELESNFEAAIGAMEGLDPRSTWIVVENFGYTYEEEQVQTSAHASVRQAHQQLRAEAMANLAGGVPPGMDAFDYMVCTAVAGGYHLFYADMDAYDEIAWFDAHRALMAGLPDADNLIFELADHDYLPFVEAAALYFNMSMDAVDYRHQNPRFLPIVKREPLYRRREKTAVNRLKTEALDIAMAIESGRLRFESQPTVLMAYGDLHTHDIIGHLNNLRLNFGIVAQQNTLKFPTIPGELNAKQLEAFGQIYFMKWAPQEPTLQEYIFELTLDDLQAMYEVLQNRFDMHELAAGNFEEEELITYVFNHVRQDAGDLIRAFHAARYPADPSPDTPDVIQ